MTLMASFARSRVHSEGDALYQPGDFIGRGLALKECGVHGFGVLFAMRSGSRGCRQVADSTRTWLPGEVWVGSDVSEAIRAFRAKLPEAN